MAACRGNFQGTFNIFLPTHFAKITVVSGKAVVKFIAGINNLRLQGGVAIKKVGYLFYVFNTLNLKVIYNSGFAGVLFG